MGVIIIDSTRVAAYIDTSGRWKSADDSYSVVIPVTSGKSYKFTWVNTSTDDVGTIFRYGFTSSSTPNSQVLSNWARTSPQSTPSVIITASKAYLILQVGTLVAEQIFSNGYLLLETVENNYDPMLRRRGMLMESNTIPPISYSSISSNAFTSWARSSFVGVSGNMVYFVPSAAGWSVQLVANDLLYKWGDIKNGIFHIKYDFSASGFATGNAFITNLCMFNITNPNQGSARLTHWDFDNASIFQNGTGSIDAYCNLSDPNISWSDTPNDSWYFGLKFYAYSDNGSRFELSNLVAEVSI